MAAVAAGAAITHAAPAAIPPPVTAEPIAASPEEMSAAPRPGTPSVLIAATPAVRPPSAPPTPTRSVPTWPASSQFPQQLAYGAGGDQGGSAKLFVFLREHRLGLFDEEFQGELAPAYADKPKGQPTVPPARLALATILQRIRVPAATR